LCERATTINARSATPITTAITTRAEERELPSRTTGCDGIELFAGAVGVDETEATGAFVEAAEAVDAGRADVPGTGGITIDEVLVLFLAADFLTADFFATDFLAVVFFAVVFLATAFLAAVFLTADFLATAFLAVVFFATDFFATVFLAATFFADTFFAAAFFAGAFLATDFFAAVFFTATGILLKSRCTPEITLYFGERLIQRRS